MAGWRLHRFCMARRRERRRRGRMICVRRRRIIRPRAKAVIQLFMHGGPSHVDLLDPKPMLDRYDGKAPPAEVADDEKLTGNLLRSPFRFHRHGQSGLEFFGGVAAHRACRQDCRHSIDAHGAPQSRAGSLWMMHTGVVAGRPSIGAWVAYGLGAENQNLPAYVVLPDGRGLASTAFATGRAVGCPRCIKACRFALARRDRPS